MAKGFIRFCYLKIIDASSTGIWDKHVFDDTHKEFFMQAQQFDQQKKYATFQEILKNNSKADQMHYLVSTAAISYIRQLNEQIPDVFSVLKKPCLPFRNFRFEILQSHRQNKSLHKIAVYFYSVPLTWIDTVDTYVVFAAGNQSEALINGQEIETETLAMTPGLSICSFQSFSGKANL